MGLFGALVSALEEKVGYPYNVIPPELMRWAKGGGKGWTATCGCIIAASSLVNMVVPQEDAEKMVSEIFAYYEQTPFPSDISNKMAHNKQFPVEKYKSTLLLPQEVAHSPLCHVSVTRWCKKAGFASGSKERSERCARLTADVAVFTAEKLNSYHVSKNYKSEFGVSAVAQECRSCHAKGKPFEQGGWTRGKMQCDMCHDVEPDHFMK